MKSMIRSNYFVCTLAVLLAAVLSRCQGFAPARQLSGSRNPGTATMIQRKNIVLFSSEDPENEEASSGASAKTSLEEKMKGWDATEEEIKAATLGGVVPGGGQNAERSDAFDVGLYILFPFMVLSGLAFALFPFIVGNIDVDSVGPPPTL